jgi:hypothetical protein
VTRSSVGPTIARKAAHNGKTKCFAESDLILVGTEIMASRRRCWRGMPRASSRSPAAR